MLDKGSTSFSVKGGIPHKSLVVASQLCVASSRDTSQQQAWPANHSDGAAAVKFVWRVEKHAVILVGRVVAGPGRREAARVGAAGLPRIYLKCSVAGRLAESLSWASLMVCLESM
jgi:hypothetical protein